MKIIKIISGILIFLGIVTILLSYPTAKAMEQGIALFSLSFLGLLSVLTGLLILIVSYIVVYSRLLLSKEDNNNQREAAVKRIKTPILAGVLYIITGGLYILAGSLNLCMQYNIAFASDWTIIGDITSSPLMIYILVFIPGIVCIATGICLFLRRYWRFYLFGAMVAFVPVLHYVIEYERIILFYSPERDASFTGADVFNGVLLT